MRQLRIGVDDEDEGLDGVKGAERAKRTRMNEWVVTS